MLHTLESDSFRVETMEYNYEGYEGYEGFNGTLDDAEDYHYLDEPGKITEDTFIMYFYLIVFPYFLLVGTIGNLIGMTILRRYSHNVWSTCMYISLLFPLDLIKLYVECGNDWLSQIYASSKFDLSFEILKLSNAMCKVYTFTYSLLLSETEWLMVAVAIETVIAYRKPGWIYTMCTRERANAIILFITVLLISLNLHYFWTHGLIQPGDDRSIDYYLCTYVSELSNSFRDHIWPIIQFCMEEAIPLLTILLCVILCASSVFMKPLPEQDKFLEKYFLDVKSLKELKQATLIICIFTVISLMCDLVVKGIVIHLIVFDYGPLALLRAFMFIISYIVLSHKFMIFYICCEKFRYDVKHIVLSICRPFKKKYRKPYVRSYTVNEKAAQDGTDTWQETEMMETVAD